jgi:hypothetical protein
MNNKEKYCITVNLPDGLNVFVGFHKEINPVTGASTYFNIWQLVTDETTLGKAKLFRSQAQAETALKLVDGKQIVYAKVSPLSTVKNDIHANHN